MFAWSASEITRGYIEIHEQEQNSECSENIYLSLSRVTIARNDWCPTDVIQSGYT